MIGLLTFLVSVVLFSDKRRKEKFSAPAEIAELKPSSGCKLSKSLASLLPMAFQYHRIVHSVCPNTLRLACSPRPWVMPQCTVVAKLTYASSAWIGFSWANDRQKITITAFIRRSKRTGFCSSQLDDFSSLVYVTPPILNYLLRFYIIPAMSYKHYSLHQQCRSQL